MPTTSDQNEVKGRFRAWVKDWQENVEILWHHPGLAIFRVGFFSSFLVFLLVNYLEGLGHALQVYILSNIFSYVLTIMVDLHDKKDKDKE